MKTIKSNEPLLSCPFCGAPAELVEGANMDNWVRCSDKQCAARTRSYHENAAGAVTRWNRRVPAPTIGGL